MGAKKRVCDLCKKHRRFDADLWSGEGWIQLGYKDADKRRPVRICKYCVATSIDEATRSKGLLTTRDQIQAALKAWARAKVRRQDVTVVRKDPIEGTT